MPRTPPRTVAICRRVHGIGGRSARDQAAVAADDTDDAAPPGRPTPPGGAPRRTVRRSATISTAARRRPRLTSMQRLDRLERVTDLLLVLLDAPRPLSLREIADRVPGYPDTHGARRQAFERDKRLLRDEGVPVLVVPIGGEDQLGYRVDPDSYYLPDLGLEAEEQAALNLAVAGVHLGEPIGRDALLKLGAGGESLAPPGRHPAGGPALGRRASGPAGRVRRHPPERGGAIRLPGGATARRRRRPPLPQRPLVRDRIRPRPGRGPDLPGRPDRRSARARRAACRPRCPPGFDVDLAFARDPWQFGDGEDDRGRRAGRRGRVGPGGRRTGRRRGGRPPGRRRRGGPPGGDRPGGPDPLGARPAGPRRGVGPRRRPRPRWSSGWRPSAGRRRWNGAGR